MRSVWLADVAATRRLAEMLVAAQPRSGGAWLIALHGELGAGKTTLVQDYLAASGVREAVRSPTYTLVEAYTDPGGLQIVHADLYRLGSPLEFEELGLREQFVPGVLWLVEWPERALGVLPPADIDLTLDVEGRGRRARLASATQAGDAWLGRLPADA